MLRTALKILLSLIIFFAAASATQTALLGDACTDLIATLSLANTTILTAENIIGGQNISTPGSCQSSAFVTSDICRIYAVVNTTAQSAVHFEMWLPAKIDAWFGRFLALGNGGLEGCIDYTNLDYGSALHFATVASDNGHDGTGGIVLLNHPEVINDFAFRAIHVEAVLGKEIIAAYYGRPHDKAYYLGCSTGGRQGVQSALLYPDDFDGILAGAPAVDFNHLLGWEAMARRFIGAQTPRPRQGNDSGKLMRWVGNLIGVKNPAPSGRFISASLWPVVSQEILKQCDGLDGVMDGLITEPDECVFRPEALLCDATHESNCLTSFQVAALKQIYQPLFGTSGQVLYPRYDPGAEADFAPILGGSNFTIAIDWYRHTIYNDSDYSFDNFSIADIEFADTINPGGISTWNGDLSAFRDRGGKIISYHGRLDPLIPSGNSKRLYDLIASTLSQRTLDDFYRLFLVPGMGHCAGGPGAWAFGQLGLMSTLNGGLNDSVHNVLLALVEWVERGSGPGVIVGTKVGGNESGGPLERLHCRYPQKSVFNGTLFVCL